MSEEKFKEAKGDLAFSQQLRDSMMSQNMAQTEPTEMPSEAPTMPQDKSKMEEAPMMEPQKGMIETIQEAVRPLIDEVKEMFSKKEEEPREVEIKIDGEMKPKEEGNEK